MGSLNLCCHRALPNARLLPCSSAINNIITIKPHLLSSSSSSSTFNHHLHFCNSPTAVASTAKQLTSPELVALEYADLNLNYDNVSQVYSQIPNPNPIILLILRVSVIERIIFVVIVKACLVNMNISEAIMLIEMIEWAVIVVIVGRVWLAAKNA